MCMDGYKKLLEYELNVYADRDKQSSIHQFNLLDKLRYMTFLLNTGTCTLLVTLGKRENDIDSILNSELMLLLWGALFSIFSVLIGYFSSVYNTKYSSELRKNNEEQLRNVSMFEDYILGQRYCNAFSPYSIKKSYADNIRLLQKILFKYENLKDVNEYNLAISQDYEKASAAYSLLSFFFFIGGVYLSQALSDSISFLLFMVMIVILGYAVYQMIINPIHHNNQKRKLEKIFEQSV